ncbi:MAG: N-acetyltransferase [Silicimonas sp.]|nr:N-acetyltransferase [Silicimonas sp.]
MVFSSDFEGIEPVLTALFETVFTASDGAAEGTLVGELARRLLTETAPDDRHVFVARDIETVVGCIIFTRLCFPDDDRTVFLMAPVAVATAWQGRGVGQGLIEYGIDGLRTLGVEVTVTYGDPRFYLRVGFEQVPVGVVRPPLPLGRPEGWMARRLTDRPLGAIKGCSVCVDALQDAAYW